MTILEQIDYMIKSLQLAKDELEYAEKYLREKDEDEKFYDYGHFGNNNRTPNGTIIRENLKMVGRMGFILSKKIALSRYDDSLYK